MFTVLSAILQIGNIVHMKKKDSEETARIQNEDVLHVISKLLQVLECLSMMEIILCVSLLIIS